MERNQAIALLNTLEIFDYDAGGEILIYANVEVNEKSVNVLNKLGLSDKEIEFEQNYCEQKQKYYFDLTKIVWKYAEWFDGDKFLMKRPDEY